VAPADLGTDADTNVTQSDADDIDQTQSAEIVDDSPPRVPDGDSVNEVATTIEAELDAEKSLDDPDIDADLDTGSPSPDLDVDDNEQSEQEPKETTAT